MMARSHRSGANSRHRRAPDARGGRRRSRGRTLLGRCPIGGARRRPGADNPARGSLDAQDRADRRLRPCRRFRGVRDLAHPPVWRRSDHVRRRIVRRVLRSDRLGTAPRDLRQHDAEATAHPDLRRPPRRDQRLAADHVRDDRCVFGLRRACQRARRSRSRDDRCRLRGRRDRLFVTAARPGHVGACASVGPAVLARGRSCADGRAARPALAGVALLLAALARVETFVLIAVATALVAWLAVRRRALPAEWPILLAWLALPVMLLHDWLLTGDPLNWASVSSLYAAGTRTRTPIALAVEMWRELAANPVLTALGVAGLVVLVRRRRYVLALGIAGVGAGIAVLMIVLAARGTQVLLTYLHPILLAAAFSAALGLDASVRLARDRLAPRQWPSVEAPVWATPIITLLAVAAVAGVIGG